MLKVGVPPLTSAGSGVFVGVSVASGVGVCVAGRVIPGVGVSDGATVAVTVNVGVGVRKGAWVSELLQALENKTSIVADPYRIHPKYRLKIERHMFIPRIS